MLRKLAPKALFAFLYLKGEYRRDAIKVSNKNRKM